MSRTFMAPRAAGALKRLSILAAALAVAAFAGPVRADDMAVKDEGSTYAYAGNQVFFACIVHNRDVDGCGMPENMIDFNIKSIASRVVLRGSVADAVYDSQAGVAVLSGPGLLNNRTPAIIEAKIALRNGYGWLSMRALSPVDGRVLYKTSREYPLYSARIAFP